LSRFHRGNRDRGAALVETALVLPMLFMLTVGIWTTARAWNVHNTLDHAVREAARFGATSDPFDAAAVRAIADQELSAAAIDPGDVTTVCLLQIPAGADPNPCSLGVTGTPQVAVHLSIPVDLNFVFFKIPGVVLNASAAARWEGS